MIDRVSSNCPLLASAAVAVASSVVLAIFLSRMGWNGAIKTYPAAMYSLMSVGGASFVLLCVTSSQKKTPPKVVPPLEGRDEPVPQSIHAAQPLPPTILPRQEQPLPPTTLASLEETAESELSDSDDPNLQQIKALLRNPQKLQDKDKRIALLEAEGLPPALAQLVFGYAVLPFERCFVQLKMGIALTTLDPHYVAVRDTLLKYQSFYRGAVSKILDPVPLEIAYVRLYGYAHDYRESLWGSEKEREIFCNICVLLLHREGNNDLVSLKEVEAEYRVAANYYAPIRFIEMQNGLEAMTCFLKHVQLSAKPQPEGKSLARFFDQDYDFNMTEDMALVILETGLQSLEKAGQDKFELNWSLAVKKGWARFNNRMLQLGKKNTFSDEGLFLWHALYEGVNIKAQGKEAAQVFDNFNEIQKGNFIAIAIDLLKNRIRLPSFVARVQVVNELQRLFNILDAIRGAPFVGTLTDEELVTFNARIIQGGLVT